MPPAFAARSDPLRVLHADGQRLLHHHVDVARRRGLHDRGMIVGAGEGRDGFRSGPVQHGGEVGEEDRPVEAELGRVLLLECGVGFEDADDLHVLAGLRGFEEPDTCPCTRPAIASFSGAPCGACAGAAPMNPIVESNRDRNRWAMA